MADFGGNSDVETVQCFILALESLLFWSKRGLTHDQVPSCSLALIAGPKIMRNGEKIVKTEIFVRQTLKDAWNFEKCYFLWSTYAMD